MAKLLLKMKVTGVEYSSESQRVVELESEGGVKASLQITCSSSLARLFDDGSAFNVEVEAASTASKVAKAKRRK